jgi:serine/threonine-protein kinase HipA
VVYVPTPVVEVRAWGKTVGALAVGDRRGAYSFEYSPEWVRSGIELAPFLMPLTLNRTYSFPDLATDTFRGLPPMIADALPDRFGNSIVDAYLARAGIPATEITSLDRLAYLGARGMGALEFLPSTDHYKPAPTALDLSDLIVSARRAIHGSLASEAESEESLQQIIDVGTSAGGARAKAIVNYNPVSKELRSGHLPPQEGFEPWLLKFDGIGESSEPSETRNFGRIEYAYSQMARAAGIEMSTTALLEEGGRAHFLTRRFDRDGDGDKIHLQSLCATDALDYNQTGVHDYSQYLNRVDGLGLPASARSQAWRRMVFNVAAANCDDHTKNFAFLCDASTGWRLAPAFDVTHSYSESSPWVNQHQMSVNGKFRDIGRKDLLAVADRYDVAGALGALSDIADAVDAWPEFANEARVPAGLIDSIGADHRRVQLRKRVRGSSGE